MDKKFEFKIKKEILFTLHIPFNYTVYHIHVTAKLRIPLMLNQIETTVKSRWLLDSSFIISTQDFQNSLIFMKFSNSLIFPCREFLFIIFPVFQSPWPAVLTRDSIIKPESFSSMADNGRGLILRAMARMPML